MRFCLFYNFLFTGIKLKAAHAAEVYEDYLKHCYPSLNMYFESFRLYLRKYLHKSAHKAENKKQEKKVAEDGMVPKSAELYNTFRTKTKDYIGFSEMLIGLVVMDPHCSDKCEGEFSVNDSKTVIQLSSKPLIMYLYYKFYI